MIIKLEADSIMLMVLISNGNSDNLVHAFSGEKYPIFYCAQSDRMS